MSLFYACQEIANLTYTIIVNALREPKGRSALMFDHPMEKPASGMVNFGLVRKKL